VRPASEPAAPPSVAPPSSAAAEPRGPADQTAAKIVRVAARPGHVASLPMVNAIFDVPASPTSDILPKRVPRQNIRPDEIFGDLPGVSRTKPTDSKDGVEPERFLRRFSAYLTDHGLNTPADQDAST
jgi:hypothetical protein